MTCSGRLFVVGWMAVFGAGCHGSSLIPPTFDAAGDTGALHDAGKEDASGGMGGGAGGTIRDAGGGAGGTIRDASGGAGGSNRDAAGDTAASTDGAKVCPHVVSASDCPSTNAECRPTWSAVLSNPVCTRSAGFYTSHESRLDCDGYHISMVGHIDTSTTYYYDVTSGDLVEIYTSANSRQSCVAGPPSGLALDCPNATWKSVCPSDGGSDAR